MFDNLSKNLSKIITKIRERKFTENNTNSIIREIRISLLEADVSLVVINDLINEIKEKCIGNKINCSFTPSQEFIKILKNKLISLMGNNNIPINFSFQPPIVILTAGLQGAGKTTTVAKIANFLKYKNNKKVLLTSTDIYRPAAIDQLQQLSQNIKVDFFSDKNIQPIEIIKKALKISKNKFYDVIVIDTAGRSHIDKKMMQEIKDISFISQPHETIFIADSMTGQDAVNSAHKFNHVIPITGTILTKIDGDTRGGAALSICFITKKPIKFICTGEKIEDIELFHPDRITSRILGMGDMFSLIEDIEEKIIFSKKEKKSQDFKTKKFNLNDFLEQLKQMRKIGGINNIINKLPMNFRNKNYYQNYSQNVFLKMECIINSMTKEERKHPELIKASRKKRIALGSGVQIQDVNKLIKQFEDMKKIMQKIKNYGIKKTFNDIKSIIRFK